MSDTYRYELQVHTKGKNQLFQAHDLCSAIAKNFECIVENTVRIIGHNVMIKVVNPNTKINFTSVYEIIISTIEEMEKYKKKICDALYELLDDLIKLAGTKRDNLAQSCVKVFIDKLEVIEIKTVDSDHYLKINMFSSQILDLLHKSDFGVTVNRLWWSDSGLSNTANQIDGIESEQEKNATNKKPEGDLFGPVPGLDPGPGLSATGGDNQEGNRSGGVEIAPVNLEESREFIDVKFGIKLDPYRGLYYLLLYANGKRLPLKFANAAELDFCDVVKNRLKGDFIVQVNANAEPSKPMPFFTFAEKPSEQ